MKRNILYQALFALGIIISMPCTAASLNKQMKAAQSSAEMSRVIKNAAKRTANSKWIELNIYTFIDQIEQEARDGEDEQGLMNTVENTKQALNNMPQGRGKKLANK